MVTAFWSICDSQEEKRATPIIKKRNSSILTLTIITVKTICDSSFTVAPLLNLDHYDDHYHYHHHHCRHQRPKFGPSFDRLSRSCTKFLRWRSTPTRIYAHSLSVSWALPLPRVACVGTVVASRRKVGCIAAALGYNWPGAVWERDVAIGFYWAF